MTSDMFEATAQGDLASVQAILEYHPESVSSRGLKGMTPLHMAAVRCHERVGRLLIDNGADVNATKGDGWTPLHHASQNGHEVMVRLLLDHGADLHVTSNTGQTALHVAAYGVSDTTITMLLAEPSRTDPLILNHEAVISVLISRGADIDATENTHGATPLHLAAYQGQLIGPASVPLARHQAAAPVPCPCRSTPAGLPQRMVRSVDDRNPNEGYTS